MSSKTSSNTWICPYCNNKIKYRAEYYKNLNKNKYTIFKHTCGNHVYVLYSDDEHSEVLEFEWIYKHLSQEEKFGIGLDRSIAYKRQYQSKHLKQHAESQKRYRNKLKELNNKNEANIFYQGLCEVCGAGMVSNSEVSACWNCGAMINLKDDEKVIYYRQHIGEHKSEPIEYTSEDYYRFVEMFCDMCGTQRCEGKFNDVQYCKAFQEYLKDRKKK